MHLRISIPIWRYEYKDNKKIAREYNGLGKDAELSSVTVSENKDGHCIDTKYATEDDMKNNRPSEQITDAQNDTLKKVTTFTYDENGNVKAETTDSAGQKTVKGGVKAAKVLTKFFCWYLLNMAITTEVYYLISTYVNTGMLGN